MSPAPSQALSHPKVILDSEPHSLPLQVWKSCPRGQDYGVYGPNPSPFDYRGPEGHPQWQGLCSALLSLTLSSWIPYGQQDRSSKPGRAQGLICSKS